MTAAGILVAVGALAGALWLWRRSVQGAAKLRAEVAASLGELARLQEEERAQQDFLRNVIDTVPGFVCVKERQGRFALANRCLAEAYGTDPQSMVGQSDHDFNDDAAQVAAFIEDDRQVIEERVTKRIGAEAFTTRTGEVRWLQTIKVPLVERDGSCHRLLAVAMDITEQRRLEQELMQAQKLQAIGQLAGGIAHDFNNVLTAILGETELLRRSLAASHPDLLEGCATIGQAAEHAAQLTRELLAFSRKAPMAMAQVEVHQLIDDVVQLVRRTFHPQVNVVLNLAEAELVVHADGTQIKNALLNLAMNARDAMSTGGTLTFATSLVQITASDVGNEGDELEPGTYVEIAVVDSGCGMDEATRNRAFEPFFTTKPPGRGTGLGLSGVYGTVRSHKGRITLHSEPEKGTAVKIYLRGTAAAYTSPDKGRTLTPPPGAGRILIIDDEPLVRRVAERILKSLGFETVSVGDGEAALQAYAQRPFDLVMLDFVMPHMDGSEVFRRLRRLDPGARVLIASGFSAEGAIDELLRDGAYGFIHKPYRQTELAQAVASALATPAVTHGASERAHA